MKIKLLLILQLRNEKKAFSFPFFFKFPIRAWMSASINSPRLFLAEVGGAPPARPDAGGKGGVGRQRGEQRGEGKEGYFKRSRAEECVM